MAYFIINCNRMDVCKYTKRLTLPVPSAAIVANGTANGINAAGMATFNLEASNFMDCTRIKIESVF